jgi:DNA-binding NtrC family response regulator
VAFSLDHAGKFSCRPEHNAAKATRRREPMMPANNSPSLHPTQPLLPRGRILLVEEDEKDLKYFTRLLGRMGYSFQAFMNYREAEGRLEREHFDFVIVNQGSPAFEAHRLVELTLARNRRTPVVVLARCLEMSCYLEAMQLGAADYLEEPLAPAEFERLVTTHCQPRQSEVSACTGN